MIDGYDLLIPSGVIVTARRRDGRIRRTYSGSGQGQFTDFPIAVLTLQNGNAKNGAAKNGDEPFVDRPLVKAVAASSASAMHIDAFSPYSPT